MNEKLWGGRFSKETEKATEDYNASIMFDHALAYEDILGSLAHAEMLQQCAIISHDEYQEIKQGLHHIAKDIATSKVKFQIEDEDIHMNIERLLTERLRETAGKLHTARSRNDQVALDLHLYLRHTIVILVEALLDLQKTILDIAKQHNHVIMPGYTHLQRAQPIYFAQHLQAYGAMLQRDIERLQQCFQNTNISPLGACALAGTTFKTNPQYVAKILGFAGTYPNTLDAVSNRDFIIEFLAAAAIGMMHISRLCEELILWHSQEFNFVTFDDAYCTGSSIMPQKKNPDIPELARGKTGRVYGALLSLLTTLKGLPLAYNKDLQEDKEPLFDTVKTWLNTLQILKPLFATLKINESVMLSATSDGYLNATALAEYLVQQGLRFRASHELVGKMVSYCITKKCNLEDLSLAELQKFSSLFDDNVKEVLQVERIAANCGKQNVEESFEFFADKTDKSDVWLHEKKQMLKGIYEKFGVNELFVF